MEPISTTYKKVWYVTGTSTGIGLSLVKKLLASGKQVVAVTRTPEKVDAEIPLEQKADVLIVKADICKEASVIESIEKGIAHFGKIDVVVNNAGFGIVGAVEELSEEEIRKAFDVNFFAAFSICKNIIPHFKQQKSGFIFNVSSICGWGSLSEFSAYTATKHALNALTFALEQELAPLGIKVVLLSPSGFKTPFVDNNMQHAKVQLSEYNSKERTKWADDIVNNGRGDPDKLNDIVIQVAEMENPPKNVFFGTHAIQYVKSEWKIQREEMDKNVPITISTDYPDAPKIDWE
ncbi:hypothetical protein DICPUDRAFT_94229 [Dictyostelium purpureum]|uniref:Short-chain dehydrogenase/reductase SDR n=1 Tax=Dictyostelium purpureum TaxID=5786 RepID=F0ZGX5_DICPU|nr:uncharacterized protein DICPUDRAFT_94229 [Dictyostelium purpureum]EGC36788.1 hypothetical protein DICPUDRAFT_94229 [Dictyostelium purpureum]|eukprot:XP_003286659.1 hypothetical protein DICPUDRAFT_94229 [Dictyostelium purpureum]